MSSLQKEDINLILKEIAQSNNILSYSKKEVLVLLNGKTTFFFYDKKELMGLSAYKKINKDWVELALLLVVSQYRKQGYGKKIYKELLEHLKERNIYCCSRNSTVQGWLRDDGFRAVSFYKLPKEFFIYLFKTKIKLYKLKDLIKQDLPSNWKYYLRFRN